MTEEMRASGDWLDILAEIEPYRRLTFPYKEGAAPPHDWVILVENGIYHSNPVWEENDAHFRERLLSRRLL